MDNVTHMNDRRIRLEQRELSSGVSSGETGSDVYMKNARVNLGRFVAQKIQHAPVDKIASVLELTEEQAQALKNAQVSDWFFDKLVEISYRMGYAFELVPEPQSNNPITD